MSYKKAKNNKPETDIPEKLEEEVENTLEEEVQEEQETAAEAVEDETNSVEALNRQLKEVQDKYLYTVAEFENYKKRTLKEKAELILNGGEKSITAILPVLDDFELAIKTAEKSDDVQAIKTGMELIFKKFLATLESLGVKAIETENKDFDVDYHEAVAMVPGIGDEKKGKVIDCVQTGYTLNDKVIRHAKVAVGQ